MLRRRLKFTAAVAVVMLGLTGFSSSHGHGHGSKSGSHSGGGGCSSSKTKNGTYSDHDYDDDDDYGSSGADTAADDTYDDTYTQSPAPSASSSEPVAETVSCAHGAKGKKKAVTHSTVRVTAPDGAFDGLDTYRVDVAFQDASGTKVDTGSALVTLDGGESRTTRVTMDHPGRVARVRDCYPTAVRGD